MSVTVVWDNVTLGSLTTNTSVYWNHSTVFQLSIIRLGTNASIELNLGDGSALVYFQPSSAYFDLGIPGTRATYTQVCRNT